MKKGKWTHLFIFLACSAFVLPAFAAEEKKTEGTKITGTIVEITPEPSGKMASIALKTDKEQIALVNNAVAKKMAKFVGKKANVTGKVTESEGKKVMEAWVFQRIDESGKKSLLRQPTERGVKTWAPDSFLPKEVSYGKSNCVGNRNRLSLFGTYWGFFRTDCQAVRRTFCERLSGSAYGHARMTASRLFIGTVD